LGMDGEQAINGGLIAWDNLKQLRSLYIIDADDKAVSAIGSTKLSRLALLSLQGSGVTDASVPTLATVPSIRMLIFVGTSIAPDQLELLRNSLPGCKVKTVP